ncbi:MAG: bifunctional metallophosphatase/5'-nucleotidase [Methanomassiliicoccales archaeon]
METITIFQINDCHAYVEPHQELFWAGDRPRFERVGGLARAASLIRGARERDERVLALDCGDTLHGTYPAVSTGGMGMVPALNAMGLDAMTAHWEFAYGPQGLEEIMHSLDHPVLGINCHRESGGTFLRPFLIKEVGDLNVGIIGIASNIVDKTMPPSFGRGLRFTLGREELPGWIARVREETDLVVVISHLGFPQDMRLASEVEGIDVLLSGHTHDRLRSPARVNGTVIIQSGCHAAFLGRLDLTVEGGIREVRHRLEVLDDSVPFHPEVQGRVDDLLDPHQEMLSETVGRTTRGLHRYTALESPMDNLLLDAVMEATGARVAFSNGWRYGAPVPPGPITMNDLWNMVPVDPPVSTVELTGREIWEMMEGNLERTFSRDPYARMGGSVKRCAGLNLYFKVENPSGWRIQEMFVGGKPLDPRERYTAAFVTEQGVPKGVGVDRRDLPLRAIDALRDHLEKHSPVSPGPRGSVVAV